MATNRQPGFTLRESYSTPVTSGFPLWLRNSAPSKRLLESHWLEFMRQGLGVRD